MAPSSSPTNRRPPATEGWERAALPSPNPKAHFSLSRGISAAAIPAAAASWKRVFSACGLHPAQRGAWSKFASGPASPVQYADAGGGAGLAPGEERYNETATRWFPLNPSACLFIAPVSKERKISDTFMARSALTGGTRPAGESGQLAQCC